MLYIALYVLVFLLWMGVEILVAPKGYQDKKGFHYGSPKRKFRRSFGQLSEFPLNHHSLN